LQRFANVCEGLRHSSRPRKGGAVEFEMHAEDAKDTIEEIKERGGTKYLALLIAGLAALLSVTEMTGDNAKQDALKNNIDAANLWSFYQAKTIRQTTLRTEAERLEIEIPSMAPAQAQAAQRLLQRWQSTIERYESELSTNEGRNELTARAKAAEQARDHSIAADNLLDLASAALQIAIVLTSASVVLGVGWLAWGGGFLGLLGLALAITGWFAPTLISF
jgi:uncharacterized protein (DUF2267 family)